MADPEYTDGFTEAELRSSYATDIEGNQLENSHDVLDEFIDNYIDPHDYNPELSKQQAKENLKEAIMTEYFNQELVSEEEFQESLDLIKQNKLVDQHLLDQKNFGEFVDKSGLHKNVVDFLDKGKEEHFNYSFEQLEDDPEFLDRKKLGDQREREASKLLDDL